MDLFLPLTSVWQLVLLIVIGILMGVMNVMAGGGSLISLPALMFMGLDGATANGTNRLSIAIQNIFAVWGFQARGIGDMRFSMFLTLAALPGAVAGAIISTTISDLLFRRLLSIIMILILITTFFKTKRKSQIKRIESSLNAKQKIAAFLGFLGIGFYIGFIQAGVGIIIIGVMSFTTGLDLVRINFHKVWVVGVCTWLAVIIFAASDHIVWPIAITLSIGNAIGGWLGSLATIAGGEKWILRVFTVTVLLMAVKLFGIF